MAQTYITPSRRWGVTVLSPEEISNFKSAWQTSQVKQVITHVPLLVNLASPVINIWQKSKDRLSTELSRANKLGYTKSARDTEKRRKKGSTAARASPKVTSDL